MNNLNNDLKSENFKKIYLLYGEERYLINQFRDRFTDVIVGNGFEMNLSSFEGSDIDFDELFDAVTTIPFMSEKRLIVIEKTGFFAGEVSDDAKNELLKIFEKQIDETVIVFVEANADKRGKLYKYIQKNGYACELGKQKPDVITKWVAAMFKKEGKTISNAALSYFVDVSSSDMSTIASEVEKLVSYTLDKKEITKEDIDSVCVKDLNAIVFDIYNYMLKKNLKKVLSIYHGMLERKEHPMKILALFVRQLNLIYSSISLRKKGVQVDAIAKKLGIRDFAVENFLRAQRNFPEERILQALEECADFEHKYKMGLANAEIGMEMILIKYTKGGC